MNGRFLFKLFLVLVLLGGGSYLGYRWFFGADPEKLIRTAAATYRQAEELYAQKNFSAASAKFEEAHQLARKAITAIEHSPRLEPEKRKELEGDAGYLHALTARDAYYAQASALDGQSLTEVVDQSTGQKFKSFHKIKDPVTKQLALTFLRNAATQKPTHQDLVQDALRSELMAPYKDWNMIYKLAGYVQNLPGKEQDTRAQYLLARIEYEQPDLFSVIPALHTRSRERMERALPLVKRLKTMPDYPLWRTLHLEAKILEWFVAHEGPKDKAKAEAKRRERLDELYHLLLAPNTGALARAKKGEGLDKPLHTWDTEGLLGILLIAVDTQMEKIRVDRDNADPLVAVFQDCLAICKKIEKIEFSPGLRQFPEEQINGTVLGVLNRSQKMLGPEYSSVWKSGQQWVQPRIEQNLRDKILHASQVSLLAEMTLREAWVLGKLGKRGDKETIHEEVYKLLQDGIKAGRATDRTNLEMLPVLALKAEMAFAALTDPALLKKTDRKELREEFMTDIHALRHAYFTGAEKRPVPYAQALANLLEGGLNDREGRLERARALLEEAIASKVEANIEPRAHAALASVMLSLSKPEAALNSLRLLERIYNRFEELSYSEKQWMTHFVRSKDDLEVMLVVSQLESAEAKLKRAIETQRTQKVTLDIVQQQEWDVQKIIDSLPIQNRQGMLARQVRVQYYLHTHRLQDDRLNLAEQELDLLQKNHPDSLELLQTDLEAMSHRLMQQNKYKLTPELLKQYQDRGDEKIKQFMQANTANRLAKLFYVTWLARSQRGKQALTYLHDPANFPESNDEDFRQIEAVVHISLGQRQEAEAVLKHLPQNPRLDAVRAVLVAQFDTKFRKIKEALSRHEEAALFRILKGQSELQSEHFAEAADIFFETLDYTRIKPQAQAGLQYALFSMAQQDPFETRKRIEKYLETQPKEPTLYLAYAVSCLYMNIVGSRWDENWDNAKNMISALQNWERYLVDQYSTSVPLLLTRAEFLYRANQTQLAYQEAQRAINLQPRDAAARTMLISLCLEENTRDRRNEARKHFQTLKTQIPDSPLINLLESQIEITEGNPKRAIELLEVLRAKFPETKAAANVEVQEHIVYEKLIDLYEKDKKFDRAAEIAAEWRKRLPEDKSAMFAEVRQAIRTKDARFVKDLEENTMKRLMDSVQQRAKKLTDYDERRLAERRKAFLDNREVHFQIEICRQYLHADRLNVAETKLENLRTVHPTNTNILYLLGQTHQAKDDFLRAAEFYDRALQQDKHQLIVAANLAWIQLKKLNNSDRAFEIIETARMAKYSDQRIEVERLPADFLDVLGLVYRERGKIDRRLYANMKGDFEKVQKRFPIDPRMRVHLAYALLGLGDDPQARYYFDEADRIMSKEDMSWLTPIQLRGIVLDVEDGRKKIKEQPVD